MMVAQVRFASGIRELANAHTRTVANDPHVPGPGLRRPVPKKVATSVAQSGAVDSGAAALVATPDGGFISLRPRLRGCLDGRLRQCRRSGEHTSGLQSPR